MKDYKRLTKRITASNTGRTVLVVPSFKQDIIEQTHRLADLEDRIERGELVDRNEYLDYLLAAKDTSELTNKDKEIEFFVKHNARVRENTDKELASLTADNAELRARLENAVALPCKVGDTVWFFDSGRILKEGKISMLQCKSDGNWKMRITHNLTYSQCKSVFDDYCNKLGIKYFTDRAAAEAHLKELKGEKK